MLAFKNGLFYAGIFFLLIPLLNGCSQEPDYYKYLVDEVEVSPSFQDKNRKKSMDQYLAILHAHLFQRPISPRDLRELKEIISSIGDKQVVRRIIFSHFMKQPSVIVPDQKYLQADPARFITETYQRFYLRDPSQSEILYMVKSLKAYPQIKPELIYYAFTMSNEYFYF